MRRLIPFIRRITGSHRQTRRLQAIESSFRLYDVSSCLGEVDLASLEVISWAPVWMTQAERLLLYALVFGLRPTRYLEIGTLKGGSALIVAAAMDATNSTGRLVCIDPEPQIDPEHWAHLEHRTTLLEGLSPQILSQAREVAGGPFDFVLIDGDHTYDGVLRDASGVLPFVTDDAYLLFHDSLYPDISRALSNFGAQHMNQVVDFGTLTREITIVSDPPSAPTRWGGLRLMQVRRNT